MLLSLASMFPSLFCPLSLNTVKKMFWGEDEKNKDIKVDEENTVKNEKGTTSRTSFGT